MSSISNEVSQIHLLFEAHLEGTAQELEYDPKWENGTGYFDNVMTLANLKPGSTARSKAPSGQQILLIGTRFGTCAIFDHHKPTGRLCTNVPARVRQLLLVDVAINTEEELYQLAGGQFAENIGVRIEAMFED